MNSLYIMVKGSFCWPKVVLASVLRALRFFVALAVMFSVCWVKDMCVSKVIPKRVEILLRGRGLFPRVILRCLLFSLLSGVKRVIEDFSAETDILLFWSYSSMVIIYCWRCVVDDRIWWCVL